MNFLRIIWPETKEVIQVKRIVETIIEVFKVGLMINEPTFIRENLDIIKSIENPIIIPMIEARRVVIDNLNKNILEIWLCLAPILERIESSVLDSKIILATELEIAKRLVMITIKAIAAKM